ncbi:MAG: hypothetical protein ACK4VO_12030 [Pseudobdellovibrio sp.]
MNKLLVLILFLLQTITACKSFAYKQSKLSEILIEIGDNYKINNIKDKLWIENYKILSATASGQNAVIKSLQVGRSTIKYNSQTFLVFSLPNGYKYSYDYWQKAVRKISNLSVDFCENSVCLKGKITSLDQFINIINRMQDDKSHIFLKLDASPVVIEQIEKWYIQYFRQHEMTPPKIVFESSPWKVALSSKDENIKNKEYTHKVGLITEENKNKIELGDNVKVSVQFVEMKKSFMRKIGIDWPQSISGQINQSNFEKSDELFLTLNAAERAGDSKTIATPNIVCRSGKEAEFWAGGEFPFRLSNSNRIREVAWKKYGIQLKVKPQIDPLGQMSIEMTAEVSTPNLANSIDGIPSIQTNKVSSHFDLTKKRTLILSGLIESSLSKNQQGLSYLTQLPIIGNLFSSRDYLDNQTDLVVLVTPELYE